MIECYLDYLKRREMLKYKEDMDLFLRGDVPMDGVCLSKCAEIYGA